MLTLNTLATILMAPAPADGEQPSLLIQFFPFILMAVIFYFLLFAPERKKRKQLQEMLATLRNGDKVVTSGGIHGRVAGVSDQIIVLRVADNVKIEVARNAVVSKVSD